MSHCLTRERETAGMGEEVGQECLLRCSSNALSVFTATSSVRAMCGMEPNVPAPLSCLPPHPSCERLFAAYRLPVLLAPYPDGGRLPLHFRTACLVARFRCPGDARPTPRIAFTRGSCCWIGLGLWLGLVVRGLGRWSSSVSLFICRSMLA